jgi:ATP-dependent phosphoenolpyruvate carboxykinase
MMLMGCLSLFWGAVSEENEPDIYRAIKPNAMLENTWIDPKTHVPDYYNVSKTQNGTNDDMIVSYPGGILRHNL